VVLKEKPIEAGFVPVSMLGGIAPAPKAKAAAATESKEAREEVGSFGD